METRQLFSILAVFALLGAALWLLRRRGDLRPRLPIFAGKGGRGKTLVSLERLARCRSFC
jgi:hypothetical protein